MLVLVWASLACSSFSIGVAPIEIGTTPAETATTPEMTEADCRAEYTIAQGWGYDDDPEWQVSAKSPQLIADAYCSTDERACDEENIMTRQAAHCIGEVNHLGTFEYFMDLHYRGPANTLWWVIEAHQWGELGSADGWGGVSMDIDAWGDRPHEFGEWDGSDCFS